MEIVAHTYKFILKNLYFDTSDAARQRNVKVKVINAELEKLMDWSQSELSQFKAKTRQNLNYPKFRKIQMYFEYIMNNDPVFLIQNFDSFFKKLCDKSSNEDDAD